MDEMEMVTADNFVWLPTEKRRPGLVGGLEDALAIDDQLQVARILPCQVALLRPRLDPRFER
jgi:hypothetical protein